MIIVASVGLNSFGANSIKKLILSGADVLRYNFSHNSFEENIQYIKNAEQAIEELNSSIKIMADLPLNKIRLGDFEGKIFSVREGDNLILRSAKYSADCNEFLPVNTTRLGEKIKLNQMITIGDGEVALRVTEIIDHESVRIEILNNGIIKYFKTFNIKNDHAGEKTIEKYTEIIQNMGDVSINYLAVSHDSEEFNEKIKEIIKRQKIDAKIILKIETFKDKTELEKIFNDKFYNTILVDLGELGVNMPFEKLGIYEQELIDISQKYKKPLWITTQILESTVNNYTPNRAEIYALTHLVKNKVNGIVLCHETTVGRRPSYTITTAKKIINAVNGEKQ